MVFLGGGVLSSGDCGPSRRIESTRSSVYSPSAMMGCSRLEYFVEKNRGVVHQFVPLRVPKSRSRSAVLNVKSTCSCVKASVATIQISSGNQVVLILGIDSAMDSSWPTTTQVTMQLESSENSFSFDLILHFYSVDDVSKFVESG